MTTPLMERLDSQQKRKLSRILGVPTNMEDAAEHFSKWEGLEVTVAEVTEYFEDLKDKLEEALIVAQRNDNDYQLRDLKRRMWWKKFDLATPAPAAPAAPAAPQRPAYTPSAPEERLRAEIRQLAEDLAYYKGFAAAAHLFAPQIAQKGAQ